MYYEFARQEWLRKLVNKYNVLVDFSLFKFSFIDPIIDYFQSIASN